MEEIWKEIQGYEGLYQVSNYGRIKSLERINKNNHKVKEKILKQNNDKDGYLILSLHKNGKTKTVRVHRLVAQAFISNPKNKPQVNHIDGNKTNNKVENLEWNTIKENSNHAYLTGLHKGVKHSDEAKKKISKANKGKLAGKNNPNYGNNCTQEIKDKISKANKGKLAGNKHPKARKVYCITTGEVFNYIKEASKKYNIIACSISSCCKGKYSYAGKHPITKEKLVWKYLE